jgi:photosystem II stability/assembly factor-like uncharacterized protein
MTNSRRAWGAGIAAVIGVLVLTLSRAGLEPRIGAELEPRFDQPDAAAQYERARRLPADPTVGTIALYERAERQLERLVRFSSAIGRSLPAAQSPATVWLSGTRVVSLNQNAPLNVLDAWTPLGPGNIGGRTRVLRFHPTRTDTLFAAGVSGGMWRSDDSGASWRPIGDGLTNIAVNSLAIDPRQPAVMFAGTGEGYFREEIRGTGLPLRGGGIFVTRDGGSRWQRLASTATPDFYWVNDLEFGVADSRRLYAATRTGVWRSVDAGESWTPLLTTGVRGGCLDLALRPDRTEDVLFASCGSYEQATIYRFPRASATAEVEVVLSESGQGRTSLAIAPSNPDVIYAMAASNEPGPNGTYRQALLAVYRSERGGGAGTWEARVTNASTPKLNTLLLTNASAAMVEECGSRTAKDDFVNMGWYVNVIAVDPRDPNRVWAAGVDWFRSDDGGRNWGLVSTGASNRPAYTHVDQHVITFHPGYDGSGNQIVLVGNDGGVFRSANARGRAVLGDRATCDPSQLGVTWESLNHGYGVTQFYHGTVFPDGARYLAGAQDNGTILGSDDAGPEGWRTIYGGDGGPSAVDPTNTQTLYAQFQWASLGKSTNGGASFQTRTQGLDPPRTDTLGPDANYLFVTPLAMDATNPLRLWLGGEFVYRSMAAEQWSKASELLPNGGVTSAIAISPTNGARLLIATHKGDVLRTQNALASTASQIQWQSARPRDGWVTSVAFDPRNNDIVYATYGNFGDAHVFRSSNGGQSWQSIDGSGAAALPDIPVHSIVVDPDDTSRLYLGTDLGVFVSLDGGGQWLAEETGFGPAVTEWLTLMRDTSGRKLLFAFTHGRGAWRVELR